MCPLVRICYDTLDKCFHGATAEKPSRPGQPRGAGMQAACRFERPGEEGAQAVRLRRSRPKGHPDPWAVLDGQAAGKLPASIIREEEVCIWMRSVSASF